MKRQMVVITGGAGLLGMALCKVLHRRWRDFEVTVIDNFSRDTDEVYRREILEGYGAQIVEMTIHQAEPLSEVLRGANIVINCAADVGGVFYNRDNGSEIFLRNRILQNNVVRAAEIAKCERFVQISSVCVYTPTMGIPYEDTPGGEHWENDELFDASGDNAGYALAKRGGEKTALSSKIPHVMVIRPTNMFGRGDHYDDKAHVIPALIEQALRGKEIVVSSAPIIERDFLFSEDAAAWIVDLLELATKTTGAKTNGEIFNLPASDGGRLTMHELVVAISHHLEGTHAYYEYVPQARTELIRRVNGYKMMELVGMASETFSDALAMTIADAIYRHPQWTEEGTQP